MNEIYLARDWVRRRRPTLTTTGGGTPSTGNVVKRFVASIQCDHPFRYEDSFNFNSKAVREVEAVSKVGEIIFPSSTVFCIFRFPGSILWVFTQNCLLIGCCLNSPQ